MNTLFSIILLAGLASHALGYNVDDYKKFIIKLSENETFVAAYDRNVQQLLEDEPRYFGFSPLESAFNCNVSAFRSAERPTSVHALRPGDVQVVGAMGDSITAGVGIKARTVLGLLVEFRGRSWSIGGQSSLEQVLSVPNVLRKFNPKLAGYNTLVDDSIVLTDGVGFNVAVSGSVASDIPNQAKMLVQRMKRSRKIDLANDWKVVTLFVGGNDLCNECDSPSEYTPANYVQHIADALDYLQANLPRTLVNLVQTINVTDLRHMNRGVCVPLHLWLCKCAAFPRDEQASQRLEQLMRDYRAGVQALVDSGRYDARDDFTVVVQPFLTDFRPPRTADNKIDFSYEAPDCFHFSQKGHALAATGLWNNMLEPVGKKSLNVGVNDKLSCPTEQRPYLATRKNSA